MVLDIGIIFILNCLSKCPYVWSRV